MGFFFAGITNFINQGCKKIPQRGCTCSGEMFGGFAGPRLSQKASTAIASHQRSVEVLYGLDTEQSLLPAAVPPRTISRCRGTKACEYRHALHSQAEPGRGEACGDTSKSSDEQRWQQVGGHPSVALSEHNPTPATQQHADTALQSSQQETTPQPNQGPVCLHPHRHTSGDGGAWESGPSACQSPSKLYPPQSEAPFPPPPSPAGASPSRKQMKWKKLLTWLFHTRLFHL